MFLQIQTRRSRKAVALFLLLGVLAGTGIARAVSVHSSGRYYQDAGGNPKFLIGYYDWAAAVDGYYIGLPSRYSTMITQGAPYKINYIRISLGIARFDPAHGSGMPDASPVPFLYLNDKADLDQWDPAFWDGVRAQCQLARDNGVIVHLCFFDGVEIRYQGGEVYGYLYSFWNPSCQTRAFYPDPDFNHNSQIDDAGEFYQLSAFNNNTGIGYYQRRVIDKTISETASYDNVFYEIGNELLGSDSAWNTAVISYVRARTDKPVSQCGGSNATNLIGLSQHVADYPSEVKTNVASLVVRGYPAWEDPDGPRLSDLGISPNELRQAAWYSFAGGAACWGGFTVDYWNSLFNTNTAAYYRNVQTFISQSGARFWEMMPQHSLVGNNSENSCLANAGSEYLVYVLNDSSVTLNLGGATGTAYYRTYDPKTAALSSQQTVTAGGTVTFNKPSGADDWVVHVTSTPGASSWDAMGTQQVIGTGTMPCVATDSAGSIHIIYLFGSGLQYKKLDPSMTQLLSETIASPSGGAYWPHIMCDSNGAPHVIFTEAVNPDMPYASRCYYTNRMGGSWSTPILALDLPSGEDVWYPRLALWGAYAYIGCQCGNQGETVGRIDRLTNLSGTPIVDRFVHTAIRSCIAIDGAGHLFAAGRYGGAGAYCQEYDSNLNPVGSLRIINGGTYGKTGGATTAWADKNNVVHMITWAIEASGSAPCTDRCGMAYNNTGRRDPDGSYQNCIQGLLGGAGGTGPDGNEGGGWWNDDVAQVIVADALNTVYVAWRGWNPRGEGLVTKVDNSAFTQFCTTEPTCGGSTCTGTEFCSSITRRRWWNCEMAPAGTGGVYVVWENAGTAYIRSVGVGSSPPPGPICFSDEFAYPDGNLNGNGGWYGSATSQIQVLDGTVKIDGGAAVYDAIKTLVCSDPGTGEIKVTVKVHAGIGGETMWSLWYDDSGANNLARWYGKGTTARGRIGGTDAVTPEQPLTGGWDRLVVKIDPAANTSQFLFNGISIGTLDHSGTHAGDTLGRIRFERIDNGNAAGHYLYFDDLMVGQRPIPGDFDDDEDVDQADFGHLQACMAGTGLRYDNGCEDADMDSDGDVDETDFGSFQRCLSGANVPADPDCAS